MSPGSRHLKRTGAAARPFAWPLLVCTVVCVLTPRPAFADPAALGTLPTPPAPTSTATPAGTPSGLTAPDTGVAPVASAPLPALSGTPSPPAGTDTTVTGPYATQILAKFSDEEAVGQKLTQAGIDLAAAHDTTQTLYDIWQQQVAETNDLQRKADTAAAKAYKDAAGLGPLDAYAADMHQLGLLAPGLGDGSRGGPAGSEQAAQDAARARDKENIDEQAYKTALAHEQQLAQQQATLTASHDQLMAELTDLRTHNQSLIARAEAIQAQIDRGLAPSFAAGSMAGGMLANPKAIAAVNYALAQVAAGKLYHFGTEGPDTFDCSGLTWAAYRSTGYTLPRVANDQFHATQEIQPSQLLPGDLLFFSTTSRTDWRTISHVAIYLGGGQMAEAAQEGEPLRVNTVWWSAFFGATRVYPAVTAPKPPAAPPASTTTTPPPATTPPPGSPTPPASTPATPTEPPPDPSPSDPTNPPTNNPPTSTPPVSGPTTNPPATEPAPSTPAPTAPATDPPTTGTPSAPASAADATTPPAGGTGR